MLLQSPVPFPTQPRVRGGPAALCAEPLQKIPLPPSTFSLPMLQEFSLPLLSTVGIRYGGDEVCAPKVLFHQGSDETQEQGLRDFMQPELEVGWVCQS